MKLKSLLPTYKQYEPPLTTTYATAAALPPRLAIYSPDEERELRGTHIVQLNVTAKLLKYTAASITPMVTKHFNISDFWQTSFIVEACKNYTCSQKLLASLDTKSNGPDGISARMLKFTAYSIAPAVTILFNSSIEPKCFEEFSYSHS